jgi:hypothetical protein
MGEGGAGGFELSRKRLETVMWRRRRSAVSGSVVSRTACSDVICGCWTAFVPPVAISGDTGSTG